MLKDLNVGTGEAGCRVRYPTEAFNKTPAPSHVSPPEQTFPSSPQLTLNDYVAVAAVVVLIAAISRSASTLSSPPL